MALHDRDYYRGSGDGGDGFSGRELGSRILRFLNWSFPIGTYLRIRVYVHITFLFLLLYRIFPDPGLVSAGYSASDQILGSLRWCALLFLGVLLHEFGHCLGCRSVGGSADKILMWPLGGLAYCMPPRRPWPEFVTVACGPLVNLVLMTGCFLVLLVWFRGENPANLNPFEMRHDFPRGYPTGIAAALITDFYEVNYFLFIFNMLLVFYPFDAGRLIQIALWTKFGYVRSLRIACRIGMGGAVIVALVGLSMPQFLLVCLAVFGFIACYQQNAQLQGMSDYDMADEPAYAGYGQAQKQSFFERVAEQRREKAAKREMERKRKLQSQIDAILEKVHKGGLASLSAKEKRILKEGTQEQRRH